MKPAAAKLPWDVKQQVMWIVRGYDRMRRDYLRMRRDIIDSGGEQHYTTYTAVIGHTADGKPITEERRAYTPGGYGASRKTEDMQLQLEALEAAPMVRQMRAVEHASAKIGAGLPDAMRDSLREAVLLSCQDGRKYPFERLCVVGFSRSEFYRGPRNKFITEIAEELGLFHGKK